MPGASDSPSPPPSKKNKKISETSTQLLGCEKCMAGVKWFCPNKVTAHALSAENSLPTYYFAHSPENFGGFFLRTYLGILH